MISLSKISNIKNDLTKIQNGYSQGRYDPLTVFKLVHLQDSEATPSYGKKIIHRYQVKK
jgi:hypothetical protein